MTLKSASAASVFTASRARRTVRQNIPTALFVLAGSATFALGLGTGRHLAPLICGVGTGLFTAPELTALVAPWRLVAVWFLMVLAMTPALLVSPIRHVWDRSFAKQRLGSVAAFLIGYLAVWTLAGMPLIGLMLLVRRYGLTPFLGAVIGGVIWQVSPLKQTCLNRCHLRATLPGFGVANVRAAVNYGLHQGGWCLAACWVWMLAPLVLPHQVAFMVAVSVFTAAERTAPPARPAWSARSTVFALRRAAAVVQVLWRWVIRYCFRCGPAGPKRAESWPPDRSPNLYG